MASSRTKYLIVAIAVIALVVGAYFGGLLQAITGANTKAQFYQQPDRGISWRGHFQDFTEMLDSAQYVTAWKSDEDMSEKIVGQVQHEFGFTGWVVDNSPGNSPVCPGAAADYRLMYSGITQDVCYANTGSTQSSGWVDESAGPLFTALKGVHTGVLNVDLYVYERDTVNIFNAPGWAKVAHDEANLLSGTGSCRLISPADRPAKPAENIVVSCDIGTDTGSGWAIFVGGSQVASLGKGPGFDVRANFPAPSIAGIYEAHLVNSLYPRDFFPFSVSVNPDQAPPKPTMKVDPAPPWLSNAHITVSWHADVNPTTKSPINTVHVTVKYTNGDPISGGGDFSGPDGSTSFDLGRDTDVEIYVVSEDNAGEFSAPADATYAVQSCDIGNKCGGGGGGPGFIFPLWGILGIIAVALIAIAMLVNRIPLFPWKVIMVLIAVILLLVAVLIYPR